MRRSSWLLLIASVGLTAGLAGCGGSSSPISGTPPGNTEVGYNFTGGTPTAAAVQIGTGAFASATLQSGALTVTIPDGTTTYSVAYACPPTPGFGNTVTSEFVIQASTKDGTSFNVSCQGLAATTGALTGSVDATAIPGAANVQIRGNLGYGTAVGASNGLFNVSLPTGSNDVALIVMDGSPQPNVLAVKILRSQTVPGALNNGAVVTFQASDLTTSQPLSVTNVPAGFVTPPAVAVEYFTANGTSFLLDGNSATTYPAVPAGAAQSGDYYAFESNSDDASTFSSAVGITQYTTTPSNPATIALPAPWSYAGPSAATLPTFTFNYSGFSSLTAVAQSGEIEWAPTATTLNTITTIATANFQGSATTVAIPDLSSVSGFIAPAASGSTIYWVADVFGGTTQEFSFTPSNNSSLSFVQNRGTYAEP